MRAVAVLEVMWDWEARTSSAGYEEMAPTWFRINPANFTGKRLYYFLGPKGEFFDDLRVTNACPQLVSSARGRGTPDPIWLSNNLDSLWPFSLLLVCGRVAQQTYSLADTLRGRERARVIELPHPANRTWTKRALEQCRRFIQEGKSDLHLEIVQGRLKATKLIPF